jgi:hypothetical protein
MALVGVDNTLLFPSVSRFFFRNETFDWSCCCLTFENDRFMMLLTKGLWMFLRGLTLISDVLFIFLAELKISTLDYSDFF